MKYRIIFDGEMQDEIFDTEEDAEEYALYLQSCERTGAETLHWSNPGDYDYDEDEFEDPEYEIIEIDDWRLFCLYTNKKGNRFERLPFFIELVICFGIVGSSEKIINRYIEVVCEQNEGLAIGFSLSTLIPVDGVLSHI